MREPKSVSFNLILKCCQHKLLILHIISKVVVLISGTSVVTRIVRNLLIMNIIANVAEEEMLFPGIHPSIGRVGVGHIFLGFRQLW